VDSGGRGACLSTGNGEEPFAWLQQFAGKAFMKTLVLSIDASACHEAISFDRNDTDA
jgi:hypothetical protein